MRAEQIVTLHGRVNDSPVLRALLLIEHEDRVERFERIDDPDPTWEYVDAAGHFHAWAAERKTPTLVTSSRHIDDHGTECDLGDRCEGYDITVWNCAICGEEIAPAFITRRNATLTFPGLTSWTVEAVVLDAELIGAESVTVRLGGEDRERFGRAAVTGWRADGDGRITLTLTGWGELGERQRPGVLAAE